MGEKLIINKSNIDNLMIIEPSPFIDERGMFSRLFCMEELKKYGFHKNIEQVNHSLTKKKGTVRGLHYQIPPKAEIKIIKCLSGAVFDVAVDIRKDSSTFLKWHSEILSPENMKIMYIPEGFAHGFQTLENNTELLYFHTESYSPEMERGLFFNDPLININWPLQVMDISEKDKNYDLLDISFKGIDL